MEHSIFFSIRLRPSGLLGIADDLACTLRIVIETKQKPCSESFSGSFAYMYAIYYVYTYATYL